MTNFENNVIIDSEEISGIVLEVSGIGKRFSNKQDLSNISFKFK